MTTKEKRKALEDFCDGRGCKSCPIYDLYDDACDFEELSDEKICTAFETAFKHLASNVCAIKDSGERREFSTGAVRDIQEGKGRCDLLPLDVIGEAIGDLILARIAIFQKTGNAENLNNVLLEFSTKFKDMYTMFLEVSRHFEEGAKKYGEYNWQKGIPTHCYIDSAVRHYLKRLRGDTDEPHDRAFAWNILCCIWTCIHKPELNDYKKEGITDAEN